MTRQRRHGNDTCFSDWLRCQEDIDSRIDAITANDIDMMFHKYRMWNDAQGARQVHLMMQVEVKILGCLPNQSQLQTLFFQHQILSRWRDNLIDGMRQDGTTIPVWHYGVYILSCPGFYPGDGSDIVDWCRWGINGELTRKSISVDTLKGILRFDLSPETIKPLSLRRHHKTQVLISTEMTPLGFPVETKIIRRS